MSHNVIYDENGLTNAKKQLSNIATELQTEVDAVIAAANRVSEGWTGSNSDLYVSKFNEYKPEMDKIVNYINDTVAAIGKTIQFFQENEVAGHQGIDNLLV